MVAALRDEIARLKGGPGRPKTNQWNGTGERTEVAREFGQRAWRGSTRSKLSIDEERIIQVAARPHGSISRAIRVRGAGLRSARMS